MSREHSQDLLLLVGEINGKLDLLLEQAHSHSVRLAVLESWRNRLLGAVALLGGVVSYLGKEHVSVLPGLIH